ncbi:MAG: hypothetical protein AAFQ61_09575, partial [Cyanobacteria bacterium J06626_23]
SRLHHCRPRCRRNHPWLRGRALRQQIDLVAVGGGSQALDDDDDDSNDNGAAPDLEATDDFDDSEVDNDADDYDGSEE